MKWAEFVRNWDKQRSWNIWRNMDWNTWRVTEGLLSSSSAPFGRAIALAVSRRLPTSMARVRARVRSSRICGGQRDTGAGFLRVLRFTLPILIPPTIPHSSIIRGWYNRPNSGRSTRWTHSDPMRKKYLYALELYSLTEVQQFSVAIFEAPDSDHIG
jgi:hypothetical protein